jgi:hypothetical protein
MKVYPYHTPDGIIELVEKQELDETTFLAQDLASQISDFGVLVDKLERERDALCKALELIEDRFVDGENTYDDWLYMGVTARQALWKIKIKDPLE